MTTKQAIQIINEIGGAKMKENVVSANNSNGKDRHRIGLPLTADEITKQVCERLVQKPEPAGEAMEKIFMANSVMCPDTPTPYYDKRIKMWVIRLQETIADASIEAVKYKMQRKLEAYRAACGLTSPAVSKIDELYRKIGCLEAENAKLKDVLQAGKDNKKAGEK